MTHHVPRQAIRDPFMTLKCGWVMPTSAVEMAKASTRKRAHALWDGKKLNIPDSSASIVYLKMQTCSVSWSKAESKNFLWYTW